jgi:hypothetical protein
VNLPKDERFEQALEDLIRKATTPVKGKKSKVRADIEACAIRLQFLLAQRNGYLVGQSR